MSDAPKKWKKTDPAPPPMILDRQAPNSLEAENGVVGAILLNPSICDDVAILLRPDDFYSSANRRIYRHLLEMNSSGGGIDLTLLIERLRSASELAEIGGEAYLAELMRSVQVTAHAVHYAKIVRDKAILRDLIETSATILGSAYEPEHTPRELIGMAEEKIFAIGDARNTNRVLDMRDVMMEVMHTIDLRSENEIDGIATGFYDLDEMLGGLHSSELIILAARPSMGKTALATNIADHVAVVDKRPVLFFSLEMSRGELALRMLCSRGRIQSQHFRGNFLTDAENESMARVLSELSAAPLYIDDSPSRTVTEIGAVARRMKRGGGLGLIVIDYIGLIEPDNPNDPRQEQVSKIARRLKGLARELEVPVLCLAQLNRQAEVSRDNRPRLSHLRESGAIEQDADVVMFVHREEYYLSAEAAADKQVQGIAEIIIAKQRNGPVGDVKLAWIAKHTLFASIAKDSSDGNPELTSYASDDF